MAHRLAYELATGKKLDKSVVLLHTCDNPRCVNPKHLVPGTQADNLEDMRTKGRHCYGAAMPFAVLTDDKVRTLRQRYAAGGVTMQALADELGIGFNTVHCAIRRKTWKHVE